MTYRNILPILISVTFFALFSCNDKKHFKHEKGFAVNQTLNNDSIITTDTTMPDSLSMVSRPSGIVLTGNPRFRLTTVYKLNYSKRSKSYFIGSNSRYRNYSEMGYSSGNQWNYNYMPGISAVYGYNMINVSIYDTTTHSSSTFFEEPVLIKTLYYPAFSNDTLYHKPIKRNYYLVSAYDEDTNKDGFINKKDLRRMYYFNEKALDKTRLIPDNYSVQSSQYDPANDYMYIFAQLDENNDGNRSPKEPIHVFWIDLKKPKYNGRQY